jgi:DNA modification methylase
MRQTACHTLHLPSYVLFHEDCLKTVNLLPRGFVDLIYADPPFFSGRSYSCNEMGFDDRWNSLSDYLEWMNLRLVGFSRILKSTGTLYLHCDWHVSHYLKVLADRVFGLNNFLNEIVWQRQSSHNDASQGSCHFGRIHDVILVYAKTNRHVWNQQYTPYDEVYLKRAYRHVEPRTGRKYALGDLTGPGGASKRNPRYEFLGIERYWRYSQTRMRRLLRKGRISHPKGKVPLLKRYLDEMRGRPIQDVWLDIRPVSTSRQNLQYPTQKPEALLTRIISTSSNRDQLVYDAFAGSGTSAAVCYKMSRKWIGSEISKHACRLTLNRLNALGCESAYPPTSEILLTSSMRLPRPSESE